MKHSEFNVSERIVLYTNYLLLLYYYRYQCCSATCVILLLFSELWKNVSEEKVTDRDLNERLARLKGEDPAVRTAPTKAVCTLYIYLYIYLYMCVCVCPCLFICLFLCVCT